jgi:heme/copper-type cytochrome/quinol oxidase subunit 1
VWLFGRPDVFLLTLVAVGAATDVVTTHARRPLLNHQAGLVLLGVFGVLSLTVFASDASIADAVIIPTATVLTALVAAPLGLLVLLWLGTTALGRPRFHVSVLFVVGAILLWVCSAANVLAAGVKSLDGLHGNNAWVAGNVHVAVAGAPTLLAVGAIYHWAPKIWGRTLNAGVGSLAFLALLGGFLASGLAYYFLGYNGASLGQLSDLTSYQKGLYGLAEGGGGLIVAGVLLVVLDLLVSIVAGRGKEAGDDPYESLTLEWATTSPPPLAGFESVPEVRSEAPLVDVRAAEVS